MSPEQIQQLAQLPLQAILLVGVVVLWRAYKTAQDARVNDLKQSYEKNLADLRTRVMLLEDRAGIHPPLPSTSSQKAVLSDFGKIDSQLD